MRVWRKMVAGAALAAALPGLAGAQQAAPRPDQLAFRALYKELVEINTTLSVGSCTKAAEAMAQACGNAARATSHGAAARELWLSLGINWSHTVEKLLQ